MGVGSGYYHLSPSNATLVWDRIPMSIAIMALLSIVIGEYMSIRLGAILLTSPRFHWDSVRAVLVLDGVRWAVVT